MPATPAGLVAGTGPAGAPTTGDAKAPAAAATGLKLKIKFKAGGGGGAAAPGASTPTGGAAGHVQGQVAAGPAAPLNAHMAAIAASLSQLPPEEQYEHLPEEQRVRRA